MKGGALQGVGVVLDNLLKCENIIKMLIYGILEANINISVGAVTADVDRLHHASY